MHDFRLRLLIVLSQLLLTGLLWGVSVRLSTSISRACSPEFPWLGHVLAFFAFVGATLPLVAIVSLLFGYLVGRITDVDIRDDDSRKVVSWASRFEHRIYGRLFGLIRFGAVRGRRRRARQARTRTPTHQHRD